MNVSTAKSPVPKPKSDDVANAKLSPVPSNKIDAVPNFFSVVDNWASPFTVIVLPSVLAAASTNSPDPWPSIVI